MRRTIAAATTFGFAALPLSAASVLLGGCSQIQEWRHPEVGVCEEYVRATLKAPATYKRAKATISDSKLPLAYWQEGSRELFVKNYQEMKSLTDDLDRERTAQGGSRTVLIEYDAANSFGTPMRGISVCKFQMKSLTGNEFSSTPSATGAIATRAAAAVGVGEEPEIPCCESKQIMDRLVRFQAKEQFVSQQVIG